MRAAGQWMPMYWAQYLADTRRLSTLEHGAYLLLIADYWQTGEPLPDDDKVLAKIAGLTKAKWLVIRVAIAALFKVADGVWRHKRVDEELAAAKQRYEKRAAAGQRGGIAKSTSVSSIARALPEQSTTQEQGTENRDIPLKDFKEIVGSFLAPSRTRKPWTREQKKAAWQTRICNEAQRTMPAEQYADFLTKWAEDDPKAVRLAEQIDKRLKAETQPADMTRAG